MCSLGAVYDQFRSMKYPTDQHQRGKFITKHACSAKPIGLTANSTSINPQFPTTYSAISTNSNSGNMNIGSAGTSFGNDNMCIQLNENNFVDPGSLAMSTGMTRDQSIPYSISNFSSGGGSIYIFRVQRGLHVRRIPFRPNTAIK
jgi:hypothetical protein